MGGRCNFECVTEKKLVGRQPYGGETEEPFLGVMMALIFGPFERV
jgi:hypothetical protein